MSGSEPKARTGTTGEKKRFRHAGQYKQMVRLGFNVSVLKNITWEDGHPEPVRLQAEL